MSYDLTFWNQKRKLELPPARIYQELMAGRAVDGLEPISPDDFIARLRQNFPGITQDGGLVFWEGGQRGMFELHSSPQHVHICCRELSDADMNEIIEVAFGFGCRLYDPQIDERFDEDV